MAKNTNVSSAVVRAWGRENIDLVTAHADAMPEAEGFTPEQTERLHAAVTKCLGESARGRLNPVVQSAFMAHNTGQRYAEGKAEAKMVEQSYRSLDSRGRKITRTFRGTVAEAREISGQVGGKGRLNRETLLATLEADFLAAQPA